MSRNKLSRLVLYYIAYLSAAFAFAAAFFVGEHSNAGGIALGMFALLLAAAAPVALRVRDMETSADGLMRALKGLEAGDWDAPLPSSGIEEIWACVSSFHAARNALREKIAGLEGEKEKLADILSNLKEGILVADPSNRIVIANENAGEFLRVDSPDLLGKSLDAFVQGDLNPIVESMIRGEEHSGTLSLPGQDRIFFFRTFFSKGPSGGLAAKGVVLRDVTEAQKLDEMRKAFVANASHELRSPAAGLQAILDAFEMGGLEDPQRRQKFISMMGREVSRLSAIIQDLLDLSELEREKVFSWEPLPIVELFEEWTQAYQLRVQEKGLTLTSEFPDRGIVLEGSSSDIERLFRNLMENALNYTPSGGVVEVGLKQNGANLTGWVKDSGIGIPREHIPRIFERFYRVDKSRSRALGGTGLGLSIAKHAVERHGGKIWVESGESGGSTFMFSIPLRRPAP